MGMNLRGHAFSSENVALFDGFGTGKKAEIIQMIFFPAIS